MNTVLYQITETSKYMMSFVIVTQKNNCIVIDGGRPEDMPSLLETIGGRHISAWILTHAHRDHISGIIELAKNGTLKELNPDCIYYQFPPLSLLEQHNVPDYDYFSRELTSILPAFLEIEPLLGNTHITNQGEVLQIDEVRIEFLFSFHDGLYANLMNDSSLVFRMDTPGRSVLFLGDLGPDGGDILFRESRDKLKADLVQMAHHGHMNVSMEVYAAIMPQGCFWCAPLWLYNEPEVPGYLSDVDKLKRMGRIRMYGEAVTRRWMDILGVKEHYVSGMGTQVVILA